MLYWLLRLRVDFIFASGEFDDFSVLVDTDTSFERPVMFTLYVQAYQYNSMDNFRISAFTLLLVLYSERINHRHKMI